MSQLFKDALSSMSQSESHAYILRMAGCLDRKLTRKEMHRDWTTKKWT